MKKRTINLVGVGKVAQTLALLWQQSGAYVIQAAGIGMRILQHPPRCAPNCHLFSGVYS
ncbi:hypothetical protein [Snodgrassella sp. CFCC 13594]|uniref:hypothetical protein n=1 Tax=Snodgrassella sp. CFCC 13594 TaxID=1775559 RepID=UPI000AF8B513|nr:hypothetical protein [Snodgrassella sp. CFCC 13594]